MDSTKNFITYKSSAGSGKTYTLVKEFLKIVFQSENPTRYRNILAITFTNKAANEMKERVIENLRSISANSDEKLIFDYEQDFGIDRKQLTLKAEKILQSILHNYSDLKISTIDKFTYKIIRAFSKDLNLTTDFDIEMDKDRVLTEAIELLISKAGEDEKLSEILINFIDNQIDNEKDWRIEKSIFEFSKELTQEENEEFLSVLKDIPEDKIKKSKDYLITKLKATETQIKGYGNSVMELFKSKGLTEADFSRGTIFNFFKKISQGEIEKILEPNTTLYNGINEDIWLPKKASASANEAMEAISEDVRSYFYEISDASKDFFLYELLSENIFSMLLIKELYSSISSLKEEENILLISDFNKLISEEIKNQPAPFIYEKIGERYKNIMIDEFQDTSVMQWHNLLPLVDNSLSIGEPNLLVGDAKQAIYRFRGGKVEQFVELPTIIDKSDDSFLEEREIALKNNYQNKFLKTNYRSHSQVIEFNNWFFDKLKLELSEEKQKIFDEQDQLTNDKNKGLVNISFIPYEREEIDELYLDKTQEKIEECLEDGFELKDIAILVDKNKYGKLLSNFLVEQGYNVLTSESLLIEENRDVIFVIDFMKYIQNNTDEKAKLGIIKYFFEDTKYSPALLSYSEKIKNRGNIKIHSLLEKLNPDFNMTQLFELSLYDLAETITRQFIEDSSTVNSFLIKLLDLVHSYSLRNNDLMEFLNYWDKNSWKISLETSESNAISIMTVHKSKGLQFPVVITSFTNWDFKPPVVPKKFIALDGEVPNLPVGILPLTNKTLGTKFAYIKETEDESIKLDKFNQLYVALTRPEQRLYVISDDNVFTKKMHKETIISSFLHRICCKHESFLENELTLGERVKLESTVSKEIEGSSMVIKETISSNWRNKIRISKQHKELWDSEKVAYGNLIHNLLAQINSSEDIKSVLNNFIEEGLISTKDTDFLENEIQEILSIKDVNSWFSTAGKVWNEREILSKESEFYRPDKVIEFPTKTLVIDFKTGERQNSHKKQIDNYGNLLSEMGYKNIEKYLLYTQEREVEKVN